MAIFSKPFGTSAPNPQINPVFGGSHQWQKLEENLRCRVTWSG